MESQNQMPVTEQSKDTISEKKLRRKKIDSSLLPRIEL